MENWGKIELFRFRDVFEGSCNTDLFWEIMDDLHEEMKASSNGHGFWHNRNMILDAFIDGAMYGLQVIETDEMYRARTKDPLFCKNGFYVLPCFCIIKEHDDGNEAVIMWTHTRARNKGFGKKLVEILEIVKADSIPQAVGFWQKCGVSLI
jgi:GNAT superfamily N-acetyltransferase